MFSLLHFSEDNFQVREPACNSEIAFIAMYTKLQNNVTTADADNVNEIVVSIKRLPGVQSVWKFIKKVQFKAIYIGLTTKQNDNEKNNKIAYAYNSLDVVGHVLILWNIKMEGQFVEDS